MEGTVKQAKSTIANVHQTTGTLNEDLKAAQSNFLLRGFFKKKKKLEKARQDSIKKAQEQQNNQQKKDDQKKKDDQPNP
jgi:phospholipid/cholesterol/gamma-HCH transport system substrate-binding protein